LMPFSSPFGQELDRLGFLVRGLAFFGFHRIFGDVCATSPTALLH